MNDLSIIIISYNTRKITRKCIETIIHSLSYNSEIKAEIIVFDNASMDGSASEIKNYNIHLKVIENKENIGFGRGNNHAVKQSTGKYLLFLNSDIEVLDDAIPKLFHFFTSKQNTFNFLGGKLFNKNMTPQASAGPYYSLPVIFGALFLGGDYYGLTRYSPNAIRQVGWVSGACFMCKKSDFDELGGFDKKIFMYMEEIDLFYRAQKSTMTIGFYPSARFIHLGSASSTKRTQPILHVYNGFLYLYRKHHSQLELNILKNMLQLKALVAIWIGRLTRNKYLIDTYEKAYHIAQEIRR
ncbi:MAG TPA: glycosyltransferase family 2 protein [Patescibacteria group bacterium]|nr:glycosyltransferase family 2 protein [Patescibacteria group bacterium]